VSDPKLVDALDDPDTTRESRAGAAGRILVVDDSRLVRVMMARHLGAAGFHVDEAESGTVALDMLPGGEYDVVITDLQMPGVDGFEVLAAAKGLAQGIEVIVLTGAHGQDMTAPIRALRMGAHDYLTKPPPSAEEVVLTVERAMEKRQLRSVNRQLLKRLETLSLTDALTGVPNRRAFEQSLDKEIARSRRHDQALGLIALDIDHFKSVNDTHGHEAGDQVLRVFARSVTAALREGDALYRTGGEEFAVILPSTAIAGVITAAERIVEGVAGTPATLKDAVISITTSAGAACLQSSADGREIRSRADAALYEAKRTGRNRVCW